MDPFRSQNLSYGSYNSPEHDDFFHAVQSDPAAFTNSAPSLIVPVTRKLTDSIRKFMQEKTLLFVVINKLAENPDAGADAAANKTSGAERVGDETTGHDPNKPTPIGFVFLKASSPDMAHHRCSEMGVDIVKEHQGRGYGGEAIAWTLDWAFKNAGLHRVELTVLGWNDGARRLYEKIGFREEGRRRECYFKDDQWWDGIRMGILKKEWDQIRLREADKS
ncbi:hypothetical protein K4F52_003668 [Lecanicillium sp. MT-2017a]|nr:hypothetical protein K4F52_003668 [Lecanicillium sp. MT-2017a]